LIGAILDSREQGPICREIDRVAGIGYARVFQVVRER
jgi:hypothetical protein